MFEGLFQPTHLLVIFGIALLVFGPKKLPELGKGIGEGIRGGFKAAIKIDETTKGDDTSRDQYSMILIGKGPIVSWVENRFSCTCDPTESRNLPDPTNPSSLSALSPTLTAEC